MAPSIALTKLVCQLLLADNCCCPHHHSPRTHRLGIKISDVVVEGKVDLALTNSSRLYRVRLGQAPELIQEEVKTMALGPNGRGNSRGGAG